MSYQLKRDESIVDGLRRIVAEEVHAASLQLGARNRDNRDEGIHEARKSVKKLRGIVRLMMPAMGDAGKRENMALRDAGRRLSGFRDAAALIETVDNLQKTYAGDPDAKDLATLREALVQRLNEAGKPEDVTAAASQVLHDLRDFKRRVNRWLKGEDNISMLAPGLRASYRRGRKALARAAREETALNYHELRKRVKEHWYQVRLLENLGPEISTREEGLKDMQEWLGEDHNLVLLREIVSKEAAGVQRLIGKYQEKLRQKAMSQGEKLYAPKPGAFTRRLEQLWDVWRLRPIAAKEAAAKRSRPAA
ncbi:MAG: CHAD domain-containing protein [Bryobacteraceae bacterium]|jgi:CHAD domain-containing protein